MEDIVIIGAGPCGLATAIDLQKQGFQPLIIEKGCLVNTIYHYPLATHFFSASNKIEIGDIPFITLHEKPSRDEAVAYYRAAAQIHRLRIHTYEHVTQVKRAKQGFHVITEGKAGTKSYRAHFVVIATGYYDTPRRIHIPGEELPHVHHYFRDAHPYADQQVVVIGGRNSAMDVALELRRVGAKVTMVYRKKEFHASVKAWVKPVIESAIKHGEIVMHWETTVQEIQEGSVIVSQQGKEWEIPADTIFAMTGYQPDVHLIQQLGCEIDAKTGAPIVTPSMETSVPGCYLAGTVMVNPHEINEIFIENGRLHGKIIAEDIRSRFII
jgi:thioredoxin reductase (NADPH)